MNPAAVQLDTSVFFLQGPGFFFFHPAPLPQPAWLQLSRMTKEGSPTAVWDSKQRPQTGTTHESHNCDAMWSDDDDDDG